MKKIIPGLLLVLVLTSCGGDGPGLAGGRNGTTTDPGTDTPVEKSASSLELLASSPQLQSDGSNTVTLTAITKDADNQIVEGVPVQFSATSGTLTVLASTSSAQGVATAELVTGGDPTNRMITVTATAETATDSLSGTVDVSVIGTSLNIQGPTTLVNNDKGIYTVTLADSGGKGIAGKTVDLSSANGNALSASSLTTDTNGRVTVEMTGSNSGTDTLTASALPDDSGSASAQASTTVSISGDSFSFSSPADQTEIELGGTEQVSVVWERNGTPQANETIRFATTRGALTNPATSETSAALNATTNASGIATVGASSTTAGFATITATAVSESTTIQRSVEFVATTPAEVEMQAQPATIGVNETSTITATVRDASNNLVKNATVEFTLEDNTNGSLSTPSAVTDSQGRAQTVYTASSTASADNGVTVTGSVVGGSNPTDKANITVSGRALFINFGTGNTIIQNTEDTHYTKNYVLMVTDSSGAGVANQTVNISVLSDTYLKGYLVGTPPTPFIEAICENEDQQPFNGILDPGEDMNRSAYPEDTNNNNVLDIGEDVNGNGFLDPDTGFGRLEPGNRALVSPGTVVTDEFGLANFQLIYPQDHAWWLNVTITAKATVAGTESTRSQRVLLTMSADDIDNPPNFYSPFGTDKYLQNNCTDEFPGNNAYDPDTL